MKGTVQKVHTKQEDASIKSAKFGIKINDTWYTGITTSTMDGFFVIPNNKGNAVRVDDEVSFECDDKNNIKGTIYTIDAEAGSGGTPTANNDHKRQFAIKCAIDIMAIRFRNCEYSQTCELLTVDQIMKYALEIEKTL